MAEVYPIPPLGKGELTIRYPSGKTFTVRGTLYAGNVVAGVFAPIVVVGDDFPLLVSGGKEPVMVLDARAIVAVGATLLYHPVHFREQLSPDMRAWVVGHPEWLHRP